MKEKDRAGVCVYERAGGINVLMTCCPHAFFLPFILVLSLFVTLSLDISTPELLSMPCVCMFISIRRANKTEAQLSEIVSSKNIKTLSCWSYHALHLALSNDVRTLSSLMRAKGEKSVIIVVVIEATKNT